MDEAILRVSPVVTATLDGRIILNFFYCALFKIR